MVLMSIKKNHLKIQVREIPQKLDNKYLTKSWVEELS